jgi:RimJ/RimL family protein N-acetyltransferase
MLVISPVETTCTVAAAVVLRPLDRGDRASLLEIFAGLGARSRQQRFLSPKTRLTEAELRHLTAVDHHDHVAVLAVSTEERRPVGVARFIRDGKRPDSADAAVAVVDAWQGRGVGTLLTNALARRAVQVGVRRFTLVMASENQAARRLAEHGTQATLIDSYSGTVELAVTLRSP